jgi:hypothetical protein
MLDVFYPWADAVRLSILKYHEFPWWNPWAMSGQPLFADPASVAVFMPDTWLVLAFGVVTGLKVAIVAYTLVGYEGSRALSFHLFGRSAFVSAVSVIPAIFPALALHFNEGHIIFVIFYLFPWLLLLALTWHESALRAVLFGVVIACFLLTYIHYTMIMAFTIIGPVVLWRFRRIAGSSEGWMKAGLVVCVALGLSLTRIGVMLAIVSKFPRGYTDHYPIVAPLSDVIRSLVEPFQDRDTPSNVAGLGWWELGAYVGLPALLLSYEGLRSDARRLWPMALAAILCLLLACNNRDSIFPSYWLHLVMPWRNMLIITRWSLFTCFFVLLCTVAGLVAIRRRGQPLLSALLGAVVVLDLTANMMHAYRNTFTIDPPPFGNFAGAPMTVNDTHLETWADERMNLVSMGAVCALVGYGLHPPARMHTGMSSYAGDYVGTRAPVRVESWSPNRMVLVGSPGDTVTLNINPSNYWSMNGKRLFPKYRAFEIDKPFQVTVPADGRMEFVASDPNWVKFAALQSALLFAAALLLLRLTRRASSPALGGPTQVACVASA